MRIPDEMFDRAVKAFTAAMPEDRRPVGTQVRGALKSSLETLVHEGFLVVAPPSVVCPECHGSKMTEGTIGWFACLRCGGRGRVPAQK